MHANPLLLRGVVVGLVRVLHVVDLAVDLLEEVEAVQHQLQLRLLTRARPLAADRMSTAPASSRTPAMMYRMNVAQAPHNAECSRNITPAKVPAEAVDLAPQEEMNLS